MNFKITADNKRKYLIGISIVLILMTGYKYFVNPAFDYLDRLGDEITIKSRMLAGYKTAIGQKESLIASLTEVKKNIKRSGAGLLSSKTPALATVEIQNKLNKIVAESGVELKTMKILDPVKTDYYTILPVQYSIVSDTRALRKILYKIETSATYLTIKEIRIRVRKKRKRFRVKQDSYEINSTLTIAGYMKKI